MSQASCSAKYVFDPVNLSAISTDLNRFEHTIVAGA